MQRHILNVYFLFTALHNKVFDLFLFFYLFIDSHISSWYFNDVKFVCIE